MRRQRWLPWLLLGMVASAVVLAAWPREEFIASQLSAAQLRAPDTIARGAYLARAGNCMGCHTVRAGPAYAGGRVMDTPFGRLLTPNITPDLDTGIGRWSADDFWHALHNGKSPDGRLLYPAFPYPNYTKVTRPDADAMYAYLRSLPAVKQANAPHELRFPYNRQISLVGWRLLYFKPGVLEHDPRWNTHYNRGAYLIEGLGHCAACHSPRNALGAPANGFAGGLMPGSGWYAPSLSSDPQTGLGNWDASHLITLLQTGVAPGASVTGPMAEVVQNSLQYLQPEDLRSMAMYLQYRPAEPVKAQVAAPAPPPALLQAGAKLYAQHCASCHGDSGAGRGPYPALAGNRALSQGPAVNAIRVVLHGGFAPATRGNPRPYSMPPFGPVLDDEQVATLVSYLRASWGNAAAPVAASEVNRYRNVPLD